MTFVAGDLFIESDTSSSDEGAGQSRRAPAAWDEAKAGLVKKQGVMRPRGSSATMFLRGRYIFPFFFNLSSVTLLFKSPVTFVAGDLFIGGYDRGRFYVLTKLFTNDTLNSVMNYAKTSKKEKRKRNISCNVARNKQTADIRR